MSDDMVWHPWATLVDDLDVFSPNLCKRTNAVDVTGLGTWVRLNSASNQAFALVVQRRDDGSHWRSWCTLDQALPYIARILRAHPSGREKVLADMSRLLGPLIVMRFSASMRAGDV
ncbi:hypothetical protein NZL82_01720 [Sphingomonas sanguinis]|uniref:hypothetical protein n=1 Tax=Sphingomonas sp. LC-1 TaxID=3110957 RepID=UPI0021BB54F5|nr:hypothetical protein [Sphingomonas sp. LC-1]MCT8000590.1 hypothetical protein [Sphingomonas sp. LC-1]